MSETVMIVRCLPVVMMLAFGACATSDAAFFGRNMCDARPAKSPDGVCYGYYKQYWDTPAGGGQVLVSCTVSEGYGHMTAVDAYSGSLEHGVALRWLSDNDLAIAMPPGTGRRQGTEIRWFADGILQVMASETVMVAHGRSATGDTEPAAGAQPARIVRITYRDLTPRDRPWGRSCYAQRPRKR